MDARTLFAAVAAGGLVRATAAAAAQAQTAPAPAPPPSPEVVVTADPAGLLERRAGAAVLGLAKPLYETPRAASLATAETLERYGVRTIDDLDAVAPGAFTDSYYGVPGALNLRGTLADTYFDGFKRIENRGTYPTPLGAAERVDVVRGPPTPLFGPGKVGGFLDITPKSSRAFGVSGTGFPDAVTGEVEASAGAYGYGLLDGRLAAPLSLRGVRGGVSLYAEAETGPGYYQGIDPRHALGQLQVDLDLAPGWRLSAGAMVERVEGAVQTPGWNRVTQALVDHRSYATGRDLTLVDLDGNGRLTPNEIGPGGLLTPYFGGTPAVDPRFTLDTGVGTARIGRRDVFASDRDFSDTDTQTATVELSRQVGARDRIVLAGFFDQLSNTRFVSYGYPADYQTRAAELRLYYDAERDLGPVKAEAIAGLTGRRTDARDKESFNSGNIALDRRDLVYGATPTDILDDPFSAEPGGSGLTWETDATSRTINGGPFVQGDVTWGPLDLTTGARYDRFSVTGRDDGTLVFGVDRGRTYTDSDGAFSWNASLAAQLPLGLRPYVTLAEAQGLQVNQAGGLFPQLIAGGAWLSTSRLSEAGVKWRAWRGRLTGAMDVYRQTRSDLGQGDAVVGTRGEGAELEARLLLTRSWSFTFAGDLQRTTVRGPDGSTLVIPPSAVGLPGADAYGGGYYVFATSQLRPGDYTDTRLPRKVASAAAVYTSAPHAWGRAGATLSLTYAGATTAGVLPGAVRLPDYAVANLSGFVERGPWRATLNVDNVGDALYFTPVADVYSSVAVLPSVGRTWRLALRRRF
ncbi:MAG: TonB-dependent receptor plug domain-containing protein [Caulobacteraceae bacterium]|nr:TonB-dependent receptor plug domain-containing protein [Caulobacter sp.]